jgi:hypothetical protein
MAYFAHIGNWITPMLGYVDSVLVIDKELIMSGEWGAPEDWIETGADSIPVRINYASVGGMYDKNYDVFYSEQPFPSWILNQTKWVWEPPIPYPQDENQHYWDEPTLSWVTRAA